MSKCQGCGVSIQNTNPNELGYSPLVDSSYCLRCFKLKNYNELLTEYEVGYDFNSTIDSLIDLKGVIIWVVDLFDFESSLIEDLKKLFASKKVVLALTKRDLFPKSVKDKKLVKSLSKRLEEFGLDVDEIVFLSNHGKKGLEELLKISKSYSTNLILVGQANAGKSTLINAILHSNTLTTSRYPKTTTNINVVKHNGLVIYDTPGYEGNKTLLNNVDVKALKTIIPNTTIKPSVYQLYENQTISIGGLVRIDFKVDKPISVVFYLSNALSLHRGKTINADNLWEKHFGDKLFPVSKNVMKKQSFKLDKDNDLVINGLGWINVNEDVNIEIFIDESVDATIRKGLI